MIYIWLAVIIIAVAIEAATPQLLSIWFAAGGLVALISAALGAPLWLQIALCLVVTLTTLLLTRPMVKRMTHFKREDTNAGRYIGREGVVLETIDNLAARGQVNVMGSVWTARSSDGSVIEKDALVLVDAIEGVKLMVSKK
jgi:membrane protein implicated in regulation of membrane protease activity